MNTRKRIVITLLLLCIPVASRAACTLEARETDGRVVVTWDTGANSSSSSTLTLYRDGWPVLTVCAAGRTGSYTIPSGYTSPRGTYKVRLRCGSGCTTVPVQGKASQSAPASSPSPTKAPTVPVISPSPTTAPTTPTVSPSQPAVTGSDSLAEEMIALINEDRAANGLGTVRQDDALTRAACVRAGEIVTQFSHTRPDGTSWSTVYSGAYAENIAKGYATAEKCEAAFMSSQGHRENILRGTYTKVGVCAYVSGGVTYWVQLFGR